MMILYAIGGTYHLQIDPQKVFDYYFRLEQMKTNGRRSGSSAALAGEWLSRVMDTTTLEVFWVRLQLFSE